MVYPVPAESFCRILFSEPLATLPVSVLYDPAGRQTNAVVRLEDGEIVLETSTLAKGFYIASIQFEDSHPVIVKIIK